METQTVIRTQGLTKRYGKFTAVDNLALSIHKGEVYGLLGPNGSGKTTTILMLLGLTEPSAGRVEVLGLDPSRRPLSVKAQVGYLPDSVGFYDNLTARENLIYIARLNGLTRAEASRRIDKSIDRMDLHDVADKRVGKFSRGMRQRLGVAELLLKQPEIIIMDEPTLGLDPDGARKFLNIILDLKASEITVLLSSHLLHQVQEVCDRVGLFNRGRVVLEGTVPELARQVLGGAYRVKLEVRGAVDAAMDALSNVPQVISVRTAGPDMLVIEALHDVRSDAASAVIQAGAQLHSLDVEAPSLDEIYTSYFEEVDHVAVA